MNGQKLEYYNDKYSKNFGEKNQTGIKEVLDFLKERSENSFWLESKISATITNVIPNGPMFVKEIKEKYKLDASEGAIIDTQISDGSYEAGESQFILKANDNNYLLSDIALNGLAYSSIGAINSFKKLPKHLQDEALKIFKNANPEKEVKLFISGEKIRAVQSSRYAPLDQYILFKDLIDELSSKVEKKNIHLISGTYNHVQTNMHMAILNSELLDVYKETYKNTKIFENGSFIYPYVRFNTADTGTAAAKVIAGFMVNEDMVELGDIISVDHIDGNTVKTFKDELNEIFAAFANLTEKLNKLNEIKIRNPLNSLKLFMKAMGFGEEMIAKGTEEFSKKDVGADCTAHHFYVFTQKFVSEQMRNEKIAERSAVKIQENITRTLNKKIWHEYESLDN